MELRRTLALGMVFAYLPSVLGGCGSAPPKAARGKARLSAEPPAASPDTIVPTETVDSSAMARTAGSADVSNDGAGTYTIPLWVPDGRAGIQPGLALSYTSHGGNGLLGMGWSLSGLSQISRCRPNRGQDGYSDTIYFYTGDPFCLDGARLKQISATAEGVEYRTQPDSFSKILSYYGTDTTGPNYFKVYLKDGRILTYGDAAESLSATFDGQQVIRTRTYTDSHYTRLAWSLSRVEDRAGNFMTIRYHKDDSDSAVTQYPEEMSYTGPGATRSVRFIYESRPDVSSGWLSGFATKQIVRLARIEMRAPNPVTPGLLRSYLLSYASDAEGGTGRSLLQSLQECDGGGVCKRPTRFSWSAESYSFSTVDTGIPPGYIFTGDIDGDGQDDLLWREWDVPSSRNPYWYYWLSVGTGFGSQSALQALSNCKTSAIENARFLDLNNDGRADLVEPFCLPAPRTLIFSSTGSGFSTTSLPDVLDLPRPASGGSNQFLADLNGDGLPDLLTAQPYNPLFPQNRFMYRINYLSVWDRYQSVGAIISDGSIRGYALDERASGRTGVLLPQAGGRVGITADLQGQVVRYDSTAPTQDEIYFLDVNGDGLSDAVIAPDTASNYLLVSINTGNGFLPLDRWNIEGDSSFERGNRYVRILDYNGDGRQDLISTASGGVARVLEATTRNTFRLRWPGLATSSDNGAATRILDLNGDGLTDLVHQVGSTLRLNIRNGERPDLLRTVTDGFGASCAFTYRPLSDGSVYTPSPSPPAYPQTAVPRSQWVTSRLACDDGIGGTRTLEYRYQDGRMDLWGRGWIGFSGRTVRDVDTGATAVTLFDNQTVTDGLYLHAGVPWEEILTVSLGGPRYHQRVSTTSYTRSDGSATGTSFIYPSTVREWVYEGTGSAPLMTSATVTQTQDRYGSATTVVRRNEVVRDSVVTGEAHVRTVNIAPMNFPDTWLIGQVRAVDEISELPSGRRLTRQTEYDYDSVTGLLRQQRIEPLWRVSQPELYLEIAYQRDSYGLVTAVTRRGSGRMRRDDVRYDDLDHTYPKLFTNAVGHVTQIAYHPGLGLPAAWDDPNGLRTRYQYDGFGRPRAELPPDGANVSISYGSDAGRLTVTRRVEGAPETVAVYDAHGRAVQERWQGFDGSISSTERSFDHFGRVAAVTTPHFPSESLGYRRFEYDVLGRLLVERNPDDTFKRVEHRGLETHAWDEKGNESYVVRDALGRVVVSAAVAPGGRAIPTRYEYAPFGLPEAIFDPNGNRNYILYDLRGRRQFVNDPDAGISTYRYNAFGEVLEHLEPDGSSHRYDYDDLGRTIYLASADGETSFQWDDAPHGLGKLASSTSPFGVVNRYSYDALSRPDQTTVQVGAELFQIGRSYDAVGRLQAVTYPAAGDQPRLQVQYAYNGFGYLRDATNVQSGETYWRAQSRNAAGQLTSEALGNGIQTERGFDALMGVLRTVRSYDAGGRDLQRLRYSYELNQDLSTRSDELAQVTETFGYDHLRRLTRWLVEPAGNTASEQQFTYDDIGNLRGRTTLRGSGRDVFYVYGSGRGAGPHAVVESSYGSYTYDEKGNQRMGPRRYTDHTAFNLPARIVGDAGDLSFRYDAAQRRVVKRSASGDETVYVEGVYERRTIAGERSHVFYIQGAERTVSEVLWRESGGVITGAATLYLHDDHLGSVDTISDGAGQVVERRKHEPFGDARDPSNPALPPPGALGSSPVRVGFTGHEQDFELGLINMRGRMYDPQVGRFLTPDPIVSTPYFGQAYNRYSYVFNSPVNATDPSGFSVDWAGVAAVAAFVAIVVGTAAMGIYQFVKWLDAGPSNSGGSSNNPGPPGYRPPQGTDPGAPVRPAAPKKPARPPIPGSPFADDNPGQGTAFQHFVQFNSGMLSAGFDFGVSTVSALLNPFGAAAGMYRAAQAGYREDGVPGAINAFNPVYHALTAGFDGYQAWQHGDYYTAGHRSIVSALNAASAITLATSLAGFAEDLAATSLQASTQALPQHLYYYTSRSTAAKIAESQLGLPGRITYLTPAGDLSPLQAALELALPRNNTATAVFRISTKGLDPTKILLQRRVTGNVFNRPGGGFEILYDGPIPKDFFERIR